MKGVTFGFCGGSNRNTNYDADAELIYNLYTETIKSPTGRTQQADKILLGTPGLATFCDLPELPIRFEFEANQRGFVIAGLSVYEVFADFSFVLRGSMSLGGNFYKMTATTTELLATNGPNGYILNLTTNVFTQITAPGWLGAGAIDELDGYFIAVEPNTQAFTISGLNDGLAWDALDFGDVEGRPENVIGMIVSHREVWFFMTDHAEPYVDSGVALFPFTRLEGAFVEQGTAAAETVKLCDNTIFWLGQNKDGAGIVWRANGYTPSRISTVRVETALQSYGDLSGATAYPYQENGHTFYRLDVQGHTWVYDVGEDEWHQRANYNGITGLWDQHPGTTHMYVFGKHLVGDATSGNIYAQSVNNLVDFSGLIRRVRRAPVIYAADDYLVHNFLRIKMRTGSVPAGQEPMITLRSSDDGGESFPNERTISQGKTGEFTRDVEWRRLGRSRRRVYEVMVEDAYFKGFTNAFLGVSED